MSRIRSIKPTFFKSLTVADLPVTARLTFIGLWTYVDDDGRGIDDVRLVKAEVWPLDDKHTTGKVDADLKALEKHDHICRYQASDGRFLHVVEWGHQKISHPQPSTKPPCPIHDDAGNPPDPLRNDSGSHPEPNRTNREQSRTPPEGSRVILPRAGADLDLDLDSKNQDPVLEFTHDGRDPNPDKRDQDSEKRGREPTGTVDPLLAQLEAVCTGKKRDTIRGEAVQLLAWARTHVDRKIIEESIGYAAQLDTPPVLPRAVAPLIERRATENGIAMPEFVPIGRVAS